MVIRQKLKPTAAAEKTGLSRLVNFDEDEENALYLPTSYHNSPSPTKFEDVKQEHLQKAKDNHAVAKFLAKWTGYRFLKKKLKAWNTKRTARVDQTTPEKSNLAIWLTKPLPTPTREGEDEEDDDDDEGEDAEAVSSVFSVGTQEQFVMTDIASSREIEMKTVYTDGLVDHDDKPIISSSVSLRSRNSTHATLNQIVLASTSSSFKSTADLVRDLLSLSLTTNSFVPPRPSPHHYCPLPIGEASGQYVFQKTIGTGSFSKVKLALHRKTGEYVAIKMIDATSLRTNPRLLQTLSREISILRHLAHPNIVCFRELAVVKDYVCIVMDWVAGGELFQFVADRKRIPEREAAPLLKQLLEAICYLHGQGIVHRDLKLENVLLDARHRPTCLKVVDFGLAREVLPHSPLHTRCGSEEYAAPEVIRGDAYDGRLSDAWSFGIIMYACLVGSLPFNPDSSRPRGLAEKIMAGGYRIPDGLISNSAAQVIKGLLVVEPSARITVGELLRHPWFSLHPTHAAVVSRRPSLPAALP